MLLGPLRGFDGPPGRGLEDDDWDPMELDPPDGAVENPGLASPATDPYSSNSESTGYESFGSE
ncbi:hypothetical protein ACJRO7_008793 [Eucalyptus globulus]|uniref:Uncharacterized protein n=1 Tax=Eucalyptus globulus TaxID=34317 RepID=A0ABD3ISX6_EUCGL